MNIFIIALLAEFNMWALTETVVLVFVVSSFWVTFLFCFVLFLSYNFAIGGGGENRTF